MIIMIVVVIMVTMSADARGEVDPVSGDPIVLLSKNVTM